MTIKKAHTPPSHHNKDLRQFIQQQLRQTVATLRLLPLNACDRPKMATSSWGDFKQIASLSSSQFRTPLRRKATPEEISQMDLWLVAVADLPQDERRIVMARACGIPWRRLEEIDGRSHTTLRKVEANGLQRLEKTYGQMI